MKKQTSLRSQFFILLALLVFLQSIALVFALLFSGVFFMLDAEAFRHFNNTADERAEAFDDKVGDLVGAVKAGTEQLSKTLEDTAQKTGEPLDVLYLNNAAYNAACIAGAEILTGLLDNNNITGAFFMLNGSNSDKENADAHSAVYIRATSGGVSGQSSNYQLELGPIAVSRHYQIATSVRWDLDIDFQDLTQEARAFYEAPLYSSAEFPRAELERHGYWSAPGTVLNDNAQVVLYTLPLLDAQFRPYGVFGVEISLARFTQSYLPNTNLPYQNSFFAIASVEDNRINLDWVIPSGPLAQVYLKQGTALEIAYVEEAGLYRTALEGLGDMYCTARDLTIYSGNSLFYDNAWTLVGFVPVDILHMTSLSVRSTLIGSILVTTVVSFAAIFLITYISTRKIAGLSAYVKGLSPHSDIHFDQTGMREIDDLTAAVETLNRSVKNAAKTTSKILELTLLPIGGFELNEESRQVALTEFVRELLDIPPDQPVSREQWQEHFARLSAHPAEGYENIYHYDADGKDARWLRILISQTDAGAVGVILDVTKDIEEHRRLAHELDYDALTRLYNRTAFKREAYNRIKTMPERVGALIFSDLDNLKYINDNFGHDMGDRLIIKAGEMFREYVQFGGIVSRISGDEFAIFLHGYASKDEIRAVLETQDKRSAGYTLEMPDGTRQKLRYSSGIAWYPDDSDDVTDLLKLADYAMYEAKHNRKGTRFEFSSESYRQNAYLLESTEAFNHLLDEGLIHFAMQPIVDLRTGDIFAYEMLMRPLTPEFSSPSEILKVAAAQSKLEQLERLVMQTAFSKVAEHLHEIGARKIFINSIPSQKLNVQDTAFLQKRYAQVFENVVIEITEAENQNPQQFAGKIAAIREFGMQIAIDDFGSGYSNEVRILSMQPDIVKIDMGLIQNIHQSADKQQLVNNLIAFCKPRGIRMIGEGVETAEDLKTLMEMGMDFVQGYFTAKPEFGLPEVREEALAVIRECQTKKKD